MTDQPTFATCTYQEFDPSYGIPVKSTIGHPRFKLRYTLEANWQHAAPEKTFINAPKPLFREQYFGKLDRTSPITFTALAEHLREVTGRDAPVVLLCFDKLWQPDTWCHRTLFGEWWLEQTGEEVPELGRTSHGAAKSITVPSGLW